MNKISTRHLNNFYNNKKNSCKSRKIGFELSKEQCRELLSVEKCAYTGIAMTLTERGNSLQKPTDVTLERVDCTKPYTMENTIAVCKAANSAKSAFESIYRDDSVAMIRKMAESLAKIEAGSVTGRKHNFIQKVVLWLNRVVGL